MRRIGLCASRTGTTPTWRPTSPTIAISCGAGFDLLVDVWGADHHGYIPRMQAVVQAYGHPKERLRVVLVQMVNLLRGGQKVEMSKRAGEFITLREVMDEVGADAAKFFFLMRDSSTHLDFDLELAKQQSQENPVYYVQYAHAQDCQPPACGGLARHRLSAPESGGSQSVERSR